MDALFRLTGVVKRYGAVTALNGLTVEAPVGAVGLLGPNGAGKTTMVRALLGLISLQEGGGEVLGLDVKTRQREIRQAVGFMPEDECLFPGTTGVEFVAYAGQLVGMPRKDALQRAHEVLDYSGLGEQRYRKVEGYSTGMKQRLKLASAIVHDPKLVIMDEPTNGLDPPGREQMIALARDLAHAKGMSVLFSSHLLPDVERVCDHVVVLGNGEALATGRILDLKAALRGTYSVRTKAAPQGLAQALRDRGHEAIERDDGGLVVTLARDEGPETIWRAASDLGAQVRELRPRQSSLEDVFLKALSFKAG